MNVVLPILVALSASVAVFFIVTFLARRFSGWFQVDESSEEAEKRRRAEEPVSSYLQLLLAKWAERLKPHLPEGIRTDLEQRIVQAGGLDALTPAQLCIYAAGASILGLAFGLFLVLATGWSAVFVLGSVLVATLYPFVWLRDRVKQRHFEILADLPYHLDLLTLCVEAGMDFGAAVQRMVDRGKQGALRQEFATFIAQLRVGKTRAEALQSMSERVGLEQLSSFLSALIQADRMGSGLGSTLRQQADQLRTERFQRAERLAGEAPVKMLIPLVLFIFPTIWVILGAPIVFDWIFRGGP